MVVSLALVVALSVLVYRLNWSENKLGALVGYALDPRIAILVAALVGAIAKSRAGLLAALSLAPFLRGSFFYRRLSPRDTLTLFLRAFFPYCWESRLRESNFAYALHRFRDLIKLPCVPDRKFR